MKTFPIYQLPVYRKFMAKKIAAQTSKAKLDYGAQQNIAGYYAYLHTLAKEDIEKLIKESKKL